MQKRLQSYAVPFVWIVGTAAVSATGHAPAYGQVLPATDGTGTSVTQAGDRIDISGGTQAGANLFHSFDELSVETGKTANFMSGSDVFNIVGRVSGQNPSYIDGRIQVTGSEANLYLVNPSGVLFGPNAQLSLQGSFTATTANQVGFGETWLNASDPDSAQAVDYSKLTANPSAFRFTGENTSAIVNQGDLTVAAGESISLVGGSVVNTGDLSAAGGEIGLVAVGGKSTVRLGAPGSLLSLEVDAEALSSGIGSTGMGTTGGETFQATDLPTLITGSPVSGASTLIVNADGSVTLGGHQVEGASVAVAGEISTRSETGTGGIVALLADSVAVVDAMIDASGAVGGTVRIGGDYRGNNAGASHLPRASRTLLDTNSVVRADGLLGEGGNVVVWADDETTAQGSISATGATQGGFVETSAHSLDVTGLRVNASGQTQAGTWLIDPTDLTIVSGAIGPNQIDPTVIQNQLDLGTNVALETTMAPGSGNGDIFLLNSINQLGGGNASLSFTGRRFSRNNTNSTINLTSTGDLILNLNQVNPELISTSSSIGEAIAALGNTNGNRRITLGAGTYNFAGPISLGRVEIQGANTANTILRDISGGRVFEMSAADGDAFLNLLTFTTTATSGFGGGISQSAGSLRIADSQFIGNRAFDGGAIYVQGGNIETSQVQFLGNHADGSGGAIALEGGAVANFEYTLFDNNRANDDAGALRISDSTLDTYNVAFRTNSSGDDGGAVGIRGTGSSLFDNVAFIGNESASSGGAIAAWDQATLSLVSVYASGNRAFEFGGAIHTNGSTLTMDNAIIEASTATAGGGLFIENGTAFITGNSTIQDNFATSSGGGLSLLGSSALTADNAYFARNTAIENGGALYLGNDSSTLLTNALIEDNLAGDMGGGIYQVDAGNLDINNATVQRNRAGNQGGAIMNNSVDGRLKVSAILFADNIAGNAGGAIASLANSVVDISYATFSGNRTDTGNGGALYLGNQASLSASFTGFTNNSAANQGGAIYYSANGPATVEQTSFASNQAGGEGGAIANNTTTGTLTLRDVGFESNTSQKDGGGIFAGTGSTTTSERDRYSNNQAIGDGGGFYSAGFATVSNSRFETNQAQNGGGIAIAGQGVLNLADTVVVNNSAVGSVSNGFGGGLHVSENGSATVTGTLATATDGQAISATTRFEGNYSNEDGGGIATFREATLHVSNTLFRQNTAGTDGGGVAVLETSRAIIDNSNFENNTATSKGGGIYRNDFGTSFPTGDRTSLINSRLIENTAGLGGGFYNGLGGAASVQNSLFRSNQAVDGGGLFSEWDLTLANTEITNNVAQRGGGLFVQNSLATVTDTSFNGNQASSGGGIQVDTASNLTVIGSTLEGNRAIAGGGLFNTGIATLINTTLSGNAATDEGGAISTLGANAELTLSSSTLSNNSAGLLGGGIVETNSRSARLLNTIVGRNIIANGNLLASDVSGTFVDQGNNLIGIVDGATGFTNSLLVGTAAAPLDPELAPLADNGGPTKTHLLQSDSPAINAAGNNSLFTTEQRGANRLVGAAMDIGAVELGADELSADIRNAIAPNQPIVASPISPTSPPPFAVPTPALAPFEPAISNAGLLALSKLGPSPAEINSNGHSNNRLNDSLSSRINGRTALRTQSQGTAENNADNVAIRQLEQTFGQSYSDYWNLSSGPELSFQDVQAILRRAQEEYKVNSAVIYAIFSSAASENAATETQDSENQDSSTIFKVPSEDDLLNLALVLPEGELITYQLPVTRQEATQQIELFRSMVSDPDDSLSYKPLAQQLYQWLLAPLENDLAAQGIQNLMYALDTGLRTAPITAMMDDQAFALNRYGISVVPSVGLMQADFPVPVRRSTMAMGVAEFEANSPLPAVPFELDVIKNFVPASQTILNEGSTLTALQGLQALAQPGILHLATHATFDAHSPESSTIELWDNPLSMKAFSQLDWQASDLELLILSACSTALSSPNAELGFAGLAAAAGVDATVGSLWQVSDLGTLALMSEFYAQLEAHDLRFEALRQAQLSLLTGQTHIQDGNLVTSGGTLALPEEWDLPERATLDHPFFWSAFTMVGNPW